MTDLKNTDQPPECPYQPGKCISCGKRTDPYYVEPVLIGNKPCGGWFPPDDKCEDCVEKESAEKNKQDPPEKKLLSAGLYPLHLSMTLDTFKVIPGNEKAFQAVRRYIDNPQGGLFITGPCGVGKTHLAAAIANNFILSGRKCRFVSSPELLLEIKTEIHEQRSITEQDLIYDYTGYDYLFLDDLGAEKVTEWTLETLYLIIDRRLRDMKHELIITSNLDLNGISQNLNDRIASRITEMCRIIRLEGNDWRLKKKPRG